MEQEKIKLIYEELQAVLTKHNVSLQIAQVINIVPIVEKVEVERTGHTGIHELVEVEKPKE